MQEQIKLQTQVAVFRIRCQKFWLLAPDASSHKLNRQFGGILKINLSTIRKAVTWLCSFLCWRIFRKFWQLTFDDQ